VASAIQAAEQYGWKSVHSIQYSYNETSPGWAAYFSSFVPAAARDWNALTMDPLIVHSVDTFNNYLNADPSSSQQGHFSLFAVLTCRWKRGLPSRCALRKVMN